MSTGTLLSRLEGVRHTGQGRWIARCPAHDDKKPSLSIRETDDGTILINDFGGCGATDVLAAVGLSFDALFPPKRIDHLKAVRRPVFREDTFELIRFEVSVTWIIGSDMHRSRMISDSDYQRLGEAFAKLERIAGLAYGR